MSNPVKIVLYAVLVILATVSGVFALKSFGKMMDRAGRDTTELERIEPERREDTNASAAFATNTVAAAETNSPLETNATSAQPMTNTVAVEASTNATESITTEASSTPATTNAISPPVTTEANSPTALAGRGASSGGKSRIGIWVGLFVISVVGLGLMIASDVSHYFGNRALKVLYNDEGEGVKNPEYEAAEELWANGNHLEAISMMREYLARNPREQYVALRIAEIYEKDLKNPLAAALEYEEVLKHKLPPDRWGWAAIHLCNLYFKLNQEQKAYVLLRRIVNEYGDTPAADKARKRLEQVEGGGVTEVAENMSEGAAPAESRPKSNLPPGFRPRK